MQSTLGNAQTEQWSWMVTQLWSWIWSGRRRNWLSKVLRRHKQPTPA